MASMNLSQGWAMQGGPVLPRQGVRLRAALSEEDQRCGARRGGRHHHWEQVSHFFFYSIHFLK